MGRFAKYESIYEVASRATRSDIVECLSAFDDLSPKAKAFALASATLYLFRSENPRFVKATPENERVEPLSTEEKKLFAQVVSGSKYDYERAFTSIDDSKEDWEESFRQEALSFQSCLGSRNPYYPFSPDTEEMWRQVCDEAPVVVLYSILAMETRLDLEALDLPINAFSDERASSSDETALKKIASMRRFLLLQIALSLRDANDTQPSAAPPQPRNVNVIKEQRLNKITSEILELFPEIKEGKIPRFSEKNDAARAL